MYTLARLLAPLGLILPAVFGLFLLGGGPRAEESSLASWLTALQRDAELDRRSEAVKRRLAGKSWVTAEVVAGRLTLDEAAERFRLLDDGRDPTTGEPPAPEEFWHRMVLTFAEHCVCERPEDVVALRARLEGPWRQRFGPDSVLPPAVALPQLAESTRHPGWGRWHRSHHRRYREGHGFPHNHRPDTSHAP